MSTSVHATHATGSKASATAAHALPRLPYGTGALAPVISAATVEVHYGKHHRTYVENLNRLIGALEYGDLPLETIILESARRPEQASIFNNAAQVWNHNFYWRSLRPKGGGVPPMTLRQKLESSFGSLEQCKQAFAAAAVSQFGSGWTWLVLRGGRVEVVKTGNADGPLASGLTPLLAVDVWEHAYYLDYQNRRFDYVNAVLDRLIDWGFAAENLGKVG